MSVVDGSFDHPLKLEEEASAPLAGGIMGQGYQCGMLWGAALAAGAQAYRHHGPGPQAEAEALITAQRLVEAFRDRNKEINCGDIIQVNLKTSSQRQLLKFFLRGGPVNCFRMAANYAQAAYNQVSAAASETRLEAPPDPVSCSAMLARKLDESDLHTVMAAGFAGGIGLSGGACGALGAAIWMVFMRQDKDGGVKKSYDNPGYDNPIALAIIERFLESADYEFECSKIVGRTFVDVADHSAYLRTGGCEKILNALATA
jgi:hypothetical protein